MFSSLLFALFLAAAVGQNTADVPATIEVRGAVISATEFGSTPADQRTVQVTTYWLVVNRGLLHFEHEVGADTLYYAGERTAAQKHIVVTRTVYAQRDLIDLARHPRPAEVKQKLRQYFAAAPTVTWRFPEK